MARRTISIEINGAKLKELLAREGKLEEVAERVGCTRPTLYSWFNTNRMTPVQLSRVAKACSLSALEIQAIRPGNELKVLFRTLRDIKVPDETVVTVKNIAQEVIRLHKLETPFRPDKKLTSFKNKSVSEMASHIRKTLGLPRVGISLDQLLSSLETIGVSVVFIPFEPAVLDAKVHAFTASVEDLKVIFVDNECAVEDVVWRILHEVTHIFSGDADEVSLEQEKFCDAVASQIVTPTEFFESNRDVLKSMLDKADKWRSPEVVKDIASHLGASYCGVLLSLQKNKIFSRGSSTDLLLWKVFHGTKHQRPTIKSLYIPVEEKAVEYWATVFDDRSRVRLVKFQHLIREGLLSGKVSMNRAAEVFAVDLNSMLELKSLWLNKLIPSDASSSFS